MPNTHAKEHFTAGLRAAVPIMLGYVPVGIAFGIMARQADFSIAQTCGMSLFVYAGASEMMGAGMYGQGAALMTIVAATFILNLRHLIMSTYMMSRLKDGNLLSRLIASFFVTDEGFAVFATQKENRHNMRFLISLLVFTYLSWNAGTLIGAVASGLLPDILTASLGISLYAMFIGLLFPSLPGNRNLIALVLLTAVCNTFLSRIIGSSWSLIASTLLCAFIGVFFVDPDAKEANADE